MFGIFRKHNIHLSPKVIGKLTVNGKSIEGATIVRVLTYAKDYIDKAVTDSDGCFSFDEKNIQSRRPSLLGDETQAFQSIEVSYKGKKYLLWSTVTVGIMHRNITEKLADLSCELKDSEEKYYFENYEHPRSTHNVFSICRWDSVQK